MRHLLIAKIVKLGQQSYSHWYRLSSLIGTIVFVFFMIPGLFIFTGKYIELYVKLYVPTFFAYSIAIIALMSGFTLLVWTLVLQYWYAGGSGSNMAPTQRLIVIGPYKICRHPMQIGAILFYFGLLTLFSSFTTGLYSALITGILGLTFDVAIEEPTLLIRFGKQYAEYKQKVPLIPFLFLGLNNSDRKKKSNN